MEEKPFPAMPQSVDICMKTVKIRHTLKYETCLSINRQFLKEETQIASK